MGVAGKGGWGLEEEERLNKVAEVQNVNMYKGICVELKPVAMIVLAMDVMAMCAVGTGWFAPTDVVVLTENTEDINVVIAYRRMKIDSCFDLVRYVSNVCLIVRYVSDVCLARDRSLRQ
ncbi:hypothetical protein Btru_046853 [Bulinus truncatus]|nr:hypothetical protein Btru_046853 [Bulinus truncatus]